MIPISVFMPVYNRSEYIKECMDSILSQTFSDFELLIVDDGSTDDTCEIILSYNDPRIRLIKNRHDFIESSNILLSEARGKYMARMDSDDIMMPDRLRIQYEYLEAHPEVDVLGGGMELTGDAEESIKHTYIENVTIDDLYRGCCICNPTAMMRRSRVLEKNLKYENESIYAEDYLFWVRAAIAGLCIRNIPEVLVKYRISDTQVSTAYYYTQLKGAKFAQRLISKWYAREEEEWALNHPVTVPVTGNLLTVIIPFLNEKEEVANTVRSIREHAGDRVDIIVINDQSYDRYDYRKDLAPYNVTYVYNIDRLGVAASRDYGIDMCTTPYFILLDAHMRFYDDRWIDRIKGMLENDDRCLLCCQTKVLQKDDAGNIAINEKAEKTYGAYLKFSGPEYIPGIVWNYSETNPFDEKTETVPAVLGAGYAASKRYWTYLKGLEGLKLYGSDEAYISLKVWMEGGRCLLLKDIETGHIYRDVSPYRRYNEEEVYNCMLIANLLMPQSVVCKVHAVALHRNAVTFGVALQMMKEEIGRWKALKSYYSRILSHPFIDVKAMNIKKLPIDRTYLSMILSRISDMKGLLLNYQPSNNGIYNGRMGILLWLCHYRRHINNEVWDGLESDLWNSIRDTVMKENYLWNFSEGACGIGWGVLYMYFHKMISEVPVVIKNIDRLIADIDMDDIDDYSFAKGLGGVFAYLSLRMMMVGGVAIDAGLLNRADRTTGRLLNSRTDLSACYYTMLYLGIRKNGVDPNNELPDINDWLEAPNSIPNNPRFWNIALMDGCLGTSIKAMIMNNNLK